MIGGSTTDERYKPIKFSIAENINLLLKKNGYNFKITNAGIEAPKLMRVATYASVTVATILIATKLGAWLATESVSLLSSATYLRIT